MPSASLGSNQVDFGGMTARRRPPPSGLPCGWGTARTPPPLAAVDPALLQLAQPANAADEIDALVGARILDAEDRRQQIVGEQAHRRPADRVGSAPGPAGHSGDTSGRPGTGRTRRAVAVAPAERWAAREVLARSRATGTRVDRPFRSSPRGCSRECASRDGAEGHGEEWLLQPAPCADVGGVRRPRPSGDARRRCRAPAWHRRPRELAMTPRS